jgi:hypothetical protein
MVDIPTAVRKTLDKLTRGCDVCKGEAVQPKESIVEALATQARRLQEEAFAAELQRPARNNIMPPRPVMPEPQVIQRRDLNDTPTRYAWQEYVPTAQPVVVGECCGDEPDTIGYDDDDFWEALDLLETAKKNIDFLLNYGSASVGRRTILDHLSVDIGDFVGQFIVNGDANE